jgi:hypothetical protein
MLPQPKLVLDQCSDLEWLWAKTWTRTEQRTRIHFPRMGHDIQKLVEVLMVYVHDIVYRIITLLFKRWECRERSRIAGNGSPALESADRAS